ncbi:DNA polymerase III epsilon subunit [Sphingomonas changbaiensis NBRC 104936]|uniref:DNA polymerase III subunit epsilon n=1 Tax=Sphingomonas changbaiensis NBRC 104936 TaxID=1219043 RepID=A0A0E9MSH0_9SPHN|nr:DNA polymerase III subunit epsilon [Sphingomonas changbaiensis]GAO40080.1 DNA polymerase III epsilon subunit [Sphingomonas changbaiensis NBRC 104936]
MREVVFDTETTGIQVSEGHRMVEIGCVELINRVESGREFHAYFNPERSMPPEAQAVHGLSEAFLSGQRLFRDCCEELLDFIEDSPLVAHNAAFDFAFLNFELGEAGRLHIPRSRMVDTLALSRSKHPGAKHSLDAMCTRYGVDRSHRIKHGALLDAQLLAQCYVELTGGRQIGLSLADAPAAAEAARQDAIVYDITRPIRPARPHAASAEELERHARFLAQITDPVWTMGTAAPAAG